MSEVSSTQTRGATPRPVLLSTKRFGARAIELTARITGTIAYLVSENR
jgi:hypothetical protein